MDISDGLRSLYFDLDSQASAIKHLDREMLDLNEIRRVLRLAQHFIDTVQPLLSSETLHVEKQISVPQDGEKIIGAEFWMVSVEARIQASQLSDLLEVLAANII